METFSSNAEQKRRSHCRRFSRRLQNLSCRRRSYCPDEKLACGSSPRCLRRSIEECKTQYRDSPHRPTRSPATSPPEASPTAAGAATQGSADTEGSLICSPNPTSGKATRFLRCSRRWISSPTAQRSQCRGNWTAELENRRRPSRNRSHRRAFASPADAWPCAGTGRTRGRTAFPR